MTTVSVFVKIVSIPDLKIIFRNVRRMHCFILCLNYMMFPLVLSPSFEAVYCYICSRRRVAVARYRMICLDFAVYEGRTGGKPLPLPPLPHPPAAFLHPPFLERRVLRAHNIFLFLSLPFTQLSPLSHPLLPPLHLPIPLTLSAPSYIDGRSDYKKK